MRKEYLKLTEIELTEIIQKMVEQYVQELNENSENNNDWVEIDEEELRELAESIDKEMLERKSLIDGFKYLNEGLIKTYPTDFVKSYIERECQLHPSQIQIYMHESNGVKIPIFGILVTPKATKEFIDLIVKKMNACGYFLSRNLHKTKYPNVMSLSFEPKFSKNVTYIVRKKCNFLYHMTSSINIDKIIKNGLCPKSKNTIFLYPSRVFCMNGDVLDNNQKSLLRGIKGEKNKDVSNQNNPNYDGKYYLLIIDLKKIPSSVKFYADPMSDEAIYTYENIPSSAIVKIEEFK